MKIDTERIRDLRRRHGLSQETLAEAAGLSERTVQRLERRGTASRESMMALAAVFDTEPAHLEDTRPELNRVLRSLQREYRFGMAGIVIGAACAVAGIGLDHVAGASPMQTGLLLGATGLIAGSASALLTRSIDRRRDTAITDIDRSAHLGTPP